MSITKSDPNRDQSLSKFCTKNRGLALLLFSAFIFLLMTLSVLTESLLFRIDQPLMEQFRSQRAMVPPDFVAAVKVLGRIGSDGTTALAVMAGLYWVLKKQWRKLALIATSVGGGEVIWLAILFAINRPRPEEVFLFGDISLPSFPSGHTEILITFWGIVLYLAYPYLKDRGWWRPALAAFFLWAILTGFIRLFLSAHYPTDVIAGYALGTAWFALSVLLVDCWIQVQ